MKKNKPHRLNLKKVWRLYQILGKEKLEKEGVFARTGTVSKEEFFEMIEMVKVKGKNPMEKQGVWNKEMMTLGLEEFAKTIREIFHAN